MNSSEPSIQRRKGPLHYHQSGGAGKVAAMLQAMNDPQLADALIESLEERNTGLAQAVKKQLIRFEDLGSLQPSDLQRVLREQEKNDILSALKLSSPKLRQQIFLSFSKRVANELQTEFELFGPIRISQVESAQDRILETLRRLIKCGEVSLD